MRLALSRFLPDRQRTTSFVLALAIEALIALALLLWRPYLPTKKADHPLSTFSVMPAPGKEAPKSAPRAQTQKRSASDSAASARMQPPVLPIPKPVLPTPPKPPAAGTLQGVLPIELGSSDIGKIKGSSAGNDTGKDSALTYGPGEGPGGMPLYKAEWYREPTNAELNGFVPKMPEGGGWALIACRTIPDYHVDNCRSLGESPVGSGLARDMRLAAWQFLVRPPRRGGKPLVGAWVSIRIDFHVTTTRQSMAGRSSEGLKLPPEPKSRYGADNDSPSGDEQSSGGFSLPPNPKSKYGPANN